MKAKRRKKTRRSTASRRPGRARGNPRSRRARAWPPYDSTKVQSLLLDKSEFRDADAAEDWVFGNDFRPDMMTESADYYRFRIKQPGQFRKKSYRTIELSPRVKAIIGKLK